MTRALLISFLISTYFISSGQDISIPAGYQILDQKEGDLNKDGIDEKVIVFNTMDSTDAGTVREIQVFKKSGFKWLLWESSKNAIGKSQDGGMMGDPFQEIQIKNGILLISQSGGSSWKWSHTDKYRFQEGMFQLIGYSSSYGRPCDYWEDFDFNILTGKIILKKEFEDCENGEQKIIKNENESFYKKGIRINLSNRNSQEMKIVTPKYKHEIYL